MEEAATLLNEFVGSLENLPSEVAHILAEVANKELAYYDIRTKLLARDASIQKHHKASGLLTENPKEVAQVAKCRSDYGKMASLGDDKIRLADRGVALVGRHLAKLERELEKLQRHGVQIGLPPLAAHLTAVQPVPGSPYSFVSPAGTPGVAAVPSTPFTTTPAGTPTDARNLKRKNAPTSIPIDNASQQRGALGSPSYAGQPSPFVSAPAGSARPARPSRLSSAFTAVNSPSASEADSYGTRERKRAPKKRRVSVAEEEEDDYEDEDAEGEDDDEELDASRNGAGAVAVEGAPDDQIFCLCQRVSFGEMVGCDNEACSYEWFHFECVGLKSQPEGEWFCPYCKPEMERTREAAGRKRK